MSIQHSGISTANAGRAIRTLRQFGIAIVAVIMAVALSIATPTFLSVQNFANILDQITVVGLMAVGVTVCIICGNFDLSMSAVAALSGVFTVYLVNAIGMVPGIVIGALTGVVMGVINGIAVVYAHVNSFIATLASGIVFRGLAIIITDGNIVNASDPGFMWLSLPSPVLNVTFGSFVFLAFTVIFGVALRYTVFGQAVYAVGDNVNAARMSGINTGLVQITAFAISGLASAIAGIILASRSLSAQPSTATGLELTAIAAAVIGGVSIMGGEGAIWRAVLGVLLLQLIANGFNLLGLNSTYQSLAQGLLIFVAVAFDQYFRRRRI